MVDGQCFNPVTARGRRNPETASRSGGARSFRRELLRLPAPCHALASEYLANAASTPVRPVENFRLAKLFRIFLGGTDRR
jgi:hypothetical protein